MYRTKNIDFSDTNIGVLGEAGEHNATRLVFTIPDELAECAYINAEFRQYDGTKLVVENLHGVDGKLTVPLTDELTKNETDKPVELTVQLVGYVVVDDVVTMKIKSPLVYGRIPVGVCGLTAQARSNPSLIERLAAVFDGLVSNMHSHANKMLLDTLTSDMISGEGVTFTPHFDAYGNLTWSNNGGLPNPPTVNISGNKTVVPAETVIDAEHPYSIYPNRQYDFGSREALYLTFLREANCEYSEIFFFTFISGSTAATLNLPAAVVWGGGNELVVEANKKYEISIRDSVALWTSTDLEVI